jgi:hypothetical protein
MSSDLRHIVVADLHRNYQGREFTEKYAIDMVNDLMILGQIFEAPNVLIRFEKESDNTVVFHCMNAGSGKDLTDAINSLLKALPDQYTKGVTYYDNPRINELIKYSYFPATVDKIDAGIDRTYRMNFDLRVR